MNTIECREKNVFFYNYYKQNNKYLSFILKSSKSISIFLHLLINIIIFYNIIFLYGIAKKQNNINYQLLKK